MTLIIGFACEDGIGLVSDTKISNPQTMEATYASKILTPLKNTPFIVGAAGYTDLFLEFNRKIREQVEQRIRQYKIANIEQLIKTGLKREEAISRVQLWQKSISSTQQALEEESKKQQLPKVEPDVDLPYVYSAENFLDDCRSLIQTISENSGYANPIELLIGIRNDAKTFPYLYRMDSKGRVEQISEFTAIGTGEPHVKMFFSRLYNTNKTINQLVTDAFRTITYVQEVVKENTVGFSDEKPPEAVIITSYIDHINYGKVSYTNINEILKQIKNEMKPYESLVLNSKIDSLIEG